MTTPTQKPRGPRTHRQARGRKSRPRSRAAILKEVDHLKDQVASLTARVAELEQEATDNDVIILREIGKEQAKGEIIQALEAGEPLDQADLSENLGLDLSLVFEACNELIAEGIVVFYDDDRN